MFNVVNKISLLLAKQLEDIVRNLTSSGTSDLMPSHSVMTFRTCYVREEEGKPILLFLKLVPAIRAFYLVVFHIIHISLEVSITAPQGMPYAGAYT